ncbi:sulfotransferase [Sphingomonas histidinilytica]|uniref:Sulfotransferase family protein n=1 Tax=Rhizorhabdus histidinilytica TaxID=439228 RepID=A0A1T5A565_9SPHN|nr:sulfotransferase [Rhizorhabdus histidinilytica]MBO9376176.1 sulfotransferase [Rhizorhabdus histidinilytica]SKB29783.1 Sulfotransferase family protein [Rhizorhabdus histidinilytica]
MSGFDPTDADALHEEAIARTGRSDFGDDGYREGLGVLIDAIKASPRRDRIAPRFGAMAINLLVSRLASQAGWNAHPELLDDPVPAPLIITGLPRSGTTILHFLMSVDPQFQWTPRWVGEAPLIRPPREEWEEHPQFRQVHDRLEATFAANPGLRAAHDMGAALADECITVMSQSFMTNTFNSTLPLPDYRRWWYEADEEPSYRRYKDNLRLMGARARDRTWLLKNPSHSYGMDAMLRVFPDARVVVLHRNPVETIASGASLIWRNGQLFEKAETGPIRLDIFARAVERMREARERHPGVAVLDVHYRDLIADKLGTVRRIYRHFGLTLGAEAEAAMQAFIGDNPQGKHGRHDYSSGEFGITDDQVRERFADYIARHDLA